MKDYIHFWGTREDHIIDMKIYRTAKQKMRRTGASKNHINGLRNMGCHKGQRKCFMCSHSNRSWRKEPKWTSKLDIIDYSV
jgi:hypothetical protein